MEMYLNTTVLCDDIRYGSYWTSAAAEHVASNYADPSHRVTHTEVAQLLKRARCKLNPEQETGRSRFFVFLTGRQRQVWETYAYLIPALNGWATSLRYYDVLSEQQAAIPDTFCCLDSRRS
ncbi:MAG: hypothetical protein H7Z21_08635 [Hymenobacter sp.]|nr:hypothetical protein [Hymenobacter sp.]